MIISTGWKLTISIGVPEMPVFIDATIVNPDLSTSFHQYTKVLLSLEDAGMWQR